MSTPTPAPAPDTALLDNLPYYDRDLELQPQLKDRVVRLLPSHSGARVPEDDPRLGRIPELFATNPLLKAELERVSSKQALDALDKSRYSLPAPAPGASEEQWLHALDNAQAQLEHQLNRQSNISLLQTYGANSWRVANYRTEADVARLGRALERMREDVVAVNRERKGLHTAIGKQLTSLETRWTELISSLLQIELANVALEAELEGLRRREEELQAQAST
ncbi:breast carcinoma amplified sequence 2 [Calocera cornea HHB12733]|uniref:Breast carcinoma amplified sequence 2 n=1 Tax=Calocera cornea HHB12733 TaxID=1353952 RepID=A0A165J2D2_9BASI|nr:breast carcinoma amplified sequence 2 [Calocera cornea HHB12733]